MLSQLFCISKELLKPSPDSATEELTSARLGLQGLSLLYPYIEYPVPTLEPG